LSRFKSIHYSILDFCNVPDKNLRICLGIIGYLYLHRQNQYQTSYLSSRFIIPFNRKCKTNIQNYLIENGYIRRYFPPKREKVIDIHLVNDANYKKEAKIFELTNKLRSLREVILNDLPFTNVIDKNIHHLNGQFFNHYYHSYRNIKIDIPRARIHEIKPELREIFDAWGDPTIKDYDLNKFGYDNNEWAGAHINAFSFVSKEFLKYTSLGDVAEVGFHFSKEVLIADQLLKTIGENDYTDFHKRTKFSKKIISVKQPVKDNRKRKKRSIKKEIGIHPAFESKYDYFLYKEVSYFDFWNSVYGYEYYEGFAKRFPQTYKYLYDVKRGIYSGTYFSGFALNIKPKIFKNDLRLFIKKDSAAFARGQLYYKLVPLVIAHRQMQINHDYWMRLKKCGIVFIPQECSVIVSNKNITAAAYIMREVLNRHIDKSIKCDVLRYELKDLPTEKDILDFISRTAIYRPSRDVPVPLIEPKSKRLFE
jgi:hypothetical protein